MKTASEIDHFAPCRWRAGVPANTPGIPRQVLALARYLDGTIATPSKVAATLQRVLEPLRDWQVVTGQCGVVGLRIGGQGWPLLLFERVDPAGIRVCKICGCTRELGCLGGCSWAGPEMCSQCDRFFATAAELYDFDGG